MGKSTSEVSNSITVIQWNCRSLFPKLDLLKILLQQHSCDIFALCETWLSPEIEINLPEFNIIRLDRADSYGGVLLGIRKGYSFYRVNLPNVLGVEVVSCQARIRERDLCIASVYIPPAAKVGLQQLSSITEVMPEPRLIVGDFNSHGCAWGEARDDNRASMIYDWCDNYNLTILNTGEVTRIASPPTRESRLDLSLCSPSLALDCKWEVIQDPYGSDHQPIVVSITNGIELCEPIDIPYDLTRNIDWKEYVDSVSRALESSRELPPLDEYKFLSDTIQFAAIHAQTKKFHGKNKRRTLPCVWWDTECAKAISAKSNAFRNYREQRTIERFNLYKAQETKFKKLIQLKKQNYWRGFVDGLTRETSMRTLWGTARRLRGRPRESETE